MMFVDGASQLTSAYLGISEMQFALEIACPNGSLKEEVALEKSNLDP